MNMVLQYLHYGGKILLPPRVRAPITQCQHIPCYRCPANLHKVGCRDEILNELKRLHIDTEQGLFNIYPEVTL